MSKVLQTVAALGGLAFVIGASACTPPEKPSIAPAPPAAVAAPASSAAVPPKTCANGSVVAADGLIDDFEDGNNHAAELAGRRGYWFTAADTAGSTIFPKGEFAPSDGGAGGSKKAGHVSGKTAAEQAAWGAVFGVGFLHDYQRYDASKYAGASFWAKVGDKSAKTFRFKVSDVNTHPAGNVCKEQENGCWNHFGTELTLSTEWKQYTIAFSELTQEQGWGSPRPAALTVNQLLSLDFAVPRGQEFDLWIDDIALVDCK